MILKNSALQSIQYLLFFIQSHSRNILIVDCSFNSKLQPRTFSKKINVQIGKASEIFDPKNIALKRIETKEAFENFLIFWP